MLESMQQYLEIGLFILVLLAGLAFGWFAAGIGMRLLFLVFARTISTTALFRSRLGGAVIAALLVFLLWSGFGGFGPGRGPGPGGTQNPKAAEVGRANLLTETTPAQTAAKPAATEPKVPPAVTQVGQQYQVRVALLGDKTVPPYTLDNRFFLLLDEPDSKPRTADELLAPLTTWRQDFQLEQVVLHYAPGSADIGNPQVRKLGRALQDLKIQLIPKPVPNNQFVP